jgi:nucleoside-diphosphate-sugar epimerase
MNLVTGATGLLGTHVMLELLQRGEQVRALKRHNSDVDTVEKIINFYKPQSGLFERINWVTGDVNDVDSLMQAMEGVRDIYHCAAIVSYHKADRQQMYKNNVDGTANVVNAALQMQVNKLCFVSSVAALGKVKAGDWLDENSEWKDSRFNTHYGITKNLSELEVWRGVQEGLNAVIVNPGFIIGPGQFDRSSASVFKKIDEGLSYYPPGGTGFISAIDCAAIMYKLMQGSASNERYVAVSENLPMKDLFENIAIALGKKPPHKVANSTILFIARMAEHLKEIFLNKKAVVTKESVKNASISFYYRNDKLASLGITNYVPISDAIAATAAFYKQK